MNPVEDDGRGPADIDLEDTEKRKIGSTISFLVVGTSSSLSMMAGEPYEYTFHTIREATNSYLENIVKHFHEEVCAVYLRGEGDITVGMMLFLTNRHARELADRLLGKSDGGQLESLGKSSISEIGNILLGGTFLNELSKFTGFKMRSSVPGLAIDSLRGIIEFPISDMSSVSDRLLMLESELFGSLTGIRIKILIIMGLADATKLRSAISASERDWK
ncbi:MAG: chemotaxis protein CheC [Nitrososphaera sp.]|nr:chemotaxis protein CheC [Nitrososphaera sp.]